MPGREIARRRRAPRDEAAYSADAPAEEAKEARPARGRRSAAPAAKKETAPPKVSKGWGSYKKTAEETKRGDFADEFKPQEGETYLIKILDDGPFAVFKEHWIERAGKKSYNCLKDENGDGDCPLCDDIGDNPKAKAMLNVVDMLEDPEKQEVLIWRIGSMVGDILENAAGESRTSPVNRHHEGERDLYWEVKLTKKGKKYDYTVIPVKAADMGQGLDWDVGPLTDEDFDMFFDQGYDDTEVFFNTYEELRDIAREKDR